MALAKKEIRKIILTKRDSQTIDEMESKSKTILEKLFEMEEYQKAKNILCFISYKSEVITDSLVMRAIKDGKRIFAPRVFGEDMRFFEIRSLQDLKEGYKGIREPEEDENKEYSLDYKKDYDDSDLILLPGAVFDTSRNRIGYGKGFYDRYLSSGFKGIKLALSFDLQIVDAGDFEVGELDVKADFILTERQLIS